MLDGYKCRYNVNHERSCGMALYSLPLRDKFNSWYWAVVFVPIRIILVTLSC